MLWMLSLCAGTVQTSGIETLSRKKNDEVFLSLVIAENFKYMSVGSWPSFAVAVIIEQEEHVPQYWDLSLIPCQPP